MAGPGVDIARARVALSQWEHGHKVARIYQLGAPACSELSPSASQAPFGPPHSLGNFALSTPHYAAGPFSSLARPLGRIRSNRWGNTFSRVGANARARGLASPSREGVGGARIAGARGRVPKASRVLGARTSRSGSHPSLSIDHVGVLVRGPPRQSAGAILLS